MLRYVVGVCLCCVSVLNAAPPSQFRVIKEWNYINYTWPGDNSHASSLRTGDYMPQNNLIAGINFYNGYYYLAIPRMKMGIPVTLARINSANPRTAPLLQPFPSWEMNELGNCTALQNVQNVAVDAEGNMWIIDGGKTETLTKTPNTTCSPKLVIYDLKSREITRSYNFPEDVVNKTLSFLYDLVIDDSDGGYAYIVDNSKMDPGLIVYSLKENKSWKIRDAKSMAADPEAINFSINNVTIRSSINLAGIALGPKTNINEQNITLNEDREVFYCPISSLHLYSTRTSYLKNENNSQLQNGEFNKYVENVGLKSAQTDGMKMDNKGVLYYGLLPTTSIARWDSNTAFASGQQVISRDENYIQWPNSFAFDDVGNILVLTNNLEKYVQGKMMLTEPNFRILMAYVGSKSYVYDDDTLVYSVYETAKQNITSTSTTTPKTSEATNSKGETTSLRPSEEPSTTRSTEKQEKATEESPHLQKRTKNEHEPPNNSAPLTSVTLLVLSSIGLHQLFKN